MKEVSTKPYLLRALYEWCTDNGYTPQIMVEVDSRAKVPPEHVRDGQIALNIGALATHGLVMGNEFIEFQARFGGVARQISVPVGAVQAIYARETGQGMAFEVEGAEDDDFDFEPADEVATEPERPVLAAVPAPEDATQAESVSQDSGSELSTEGRADNDDRDPPPSSGRPHLKVVK